MLIHPSFNLLNSSFLIYFRNPKVSKLIYIQISKIIIFASDLSNILVISLSTLFLFFLKKKFSKNGGDDRSRTCDPLNANQMLSQLSYTPIQLLESLRLWRPNLWEVVHAVNRHLIKSLFFFYFFLLLNKRLLNINRRKDEKPVYSYTCSIYEFLPEYK